MQTGLWLALAGPTVAAIAAGIACDAARGVTVLRAAALHARAAAAGRAAPG